jgi:hypothetical protein
LSRFSRNAGVGARGAEAEDRRLVVRCLDRGDRRHLWLPLRVEIGILQPRDRKGDVLRGERLAVVERSTLGERHGQRETIFGELPGVGEVGHVGERLVNFDERLEEREAKRRVVGGEGGDVGVENFDLGLNTDIEGTARLRRLLSGDTAAERVRTGDETGAGGAGGGGGRVLEEVTSSSHAVAPSVGMGMRSDIKDEE